MATSQIRSLVYTLVAVGIFSAIVAVDSDPSGFGPFFVGGIAYIAGAVLLVVGLMSVRGRSRLYLLMVGLGLAGVLLSVYLLTGGNGSPLSGNQVNDTCTTIQTGNSNSSAGVSFTTSCVGSPYYSYWSILLNLAFWTPLVGSIVYSMPVWIEPAKRSLMASSSRILKGAVPAGTLLLLTFGLDNPSSGYPVLFNGHSPFNPFTAYNFCDSSTFGMVTCVQVNPATYLLDYAFWIAVATFFALAISGFFDFFDSAFTHRTLAGALAMETASGAPETGTGPLAETPKTVGNKASKVRKSPLIRGAVFSLILVVLLLLGVVLVPTLNASSGVVAAQGTSILVGHDDFAYIPFSISHNSTLSGSLSANVEVQAYLVNSSAPFWDNGPNVPPSGYIFSSGPTSSVTLNLSLREGTYYLVFYNIVNSSLASSATVDVTRAIELISG